MHKDSEQVMMQMRKRNMITMLGHQNFPQLSCDSQISLPKKTTEKKNKQTRKLICSRVHNEKMSTSEIYPFIKERNPNC